MGTGMSMGSGNVEVISDLDKSNFSGMLGAEAQVEGVKVSQPIETSNVFNFQNFTLNRRSDTRRGKGCVANRGFVCSFVC